METNCRGVNMKSRKHQGEQNVYEKYENNVFFLLFTFFILINEYLTWEKLFSTAKDVTLDWVGRRQRYMSFVIFNVPPAFL